MYSRYLTTALEALVRKTATVLASLAVGLASIAAAPLATAVSGDVRFTNLTTADGLGASNTLTLPVLTPAQAFGGAPAPAWCFTGPAL